MHTNRISLARKILLGLAAAATLALLAGCEGITLTNLTPASMPENPSQIYTFTLRVLPRTNTILKASIAPHIVIDGQNYDMKPSTLGGGLYEFEYPLPASHSDDLAYYYLVTYSAEGNNVQTPGEAYTEVEHVKLVHRYVLSLEVNRGPVGAMVRILGRGFTPQDLVYFSGNSARTVFESPTSISFYVPALEPGKNYSVAINAGILPVGTFRIDPSTVTVAPQQLTLATGSRQSLTFSIPNPAPAGGTLLDLTTDVPESVIMPEVVVPMGATSVTVTVEGGRPGTGSLFLKGFGNGELTIPVAVSAK